MSHCLPKHVKEQEKKQFIKEINDYVNNGHIRRTFTAKRLSKNSVFNSHKIGSSLAPDLIDMGILFYVSKYDTHAAIYGVNKEKLAGWLRMHSK